LHHLYGLRVTDLGPFRAIRTAVLHELAMEQMTYGGPVEVMAKVARRGYGVGEVSVSYRRRARPLQDLRHPWSGAKNSNAPARSCLFHSSSGGQELVIVEGGGLLAGPLGVAQDDQQHLNRGAVEVGQARLAAGRPLAGIG
jgi:hypothetical protein